MIQVTPSTPIHYSRDASSNGQTASAHIRVAIIEVFEDGTVGLKALDSAFTASPVSYDATGEPGTFHLLSDDQE